MEEFSDNSEIPNGEKAYGITKLQVLRGGLGVGVKSCTDGNIDG